MSLTRITDPLVFRIAALTGIVFSLVGKVSALLRSIDQAILGGIMLLLFGTIAGAGISSLLHSRINLSSARNVVIISVTLTTGIGGAAFQYGRFSLAGIGLSAVVAVVLNLLLPERAEDRTPTPSPVAEAPDEAAQHGSETTHNAAGAGETPATAAPTADASTAAPATAPEA